MKNFIKTKISQHCCKSFNGTKTGFHLSAAYFQSLKLRLKGIYKHIFSDPSCGDGNARFTAVHLKPLSVHTSKLWKKQLFLTWSVYFCEFLHCFLTVNAQVTINEQKYWFLIHTWSDKDIKGTVVNRTL